jgi:LPS O-antigen subunit length determinant protein (WzzB/FepE family)
MESNPEEFMNTIDRWGDIITELNKYTTEEERRLVFEKMRSIRLDAVHKQIMQELCAPTDPKPHKSVSIMTTSEMKAKALTMLKQQFNATYHNAPGSQYP